MNKAKSKSIEVRGLSQSTRICLVYVSFIALFALGFQVFLGLPVFHRGVSESRSSEYLTWEVYSEKRKQEAIDSGKTVFVVLRSPMSFWTPELFRRKHFAKKFDLDNVVFLDLVWEWGNPGVARQYFEKFGSSKEAFIIRLDSNDAEIFWPSKEHRPKYLNAD